MRIGSWKSDVPRRAGLKFLTAFPIFLAALLLSPALARGQRGAVTLPRNLVDLSTGANQIIQARVVAATVEADPRYTNLQTLVLSLAVEDVLKGQAPTSLTIREFLWDVRDISDRAGYRAGDEIVLFLNRPTTLGFVSPVGLEQGRFRVVRAGDGQEYVLNANQNSGLLNNVVRSGGLNLAQLSAKSRATMQSFQRGPLPLSALKESVHLLLQGAHR